MRLVAFFLLAAFLHVSAGSRAQSQLTLTEKDASLEKVFKDIQQQSSYYFVYREDMLSQAKKVSLRVRGASLDQVLHLCFQDQPITYSIVSNAIVLQKRADPLPPAAEGPKPSGDVSGRILDEDGTAVPSATVTVKGTHTVVQADASGHFDLRGLSPDAVLVISCVGFETVEWPVSGRRDMSVSLKRKTGQLDDMQIIAYGTTTRRLTTGDQATVKGSEIQEQPVSDPLLALEGRVAGLYIQQASGIPGAYSTVRIRGQNSIANGNDPLYIVDGVPFGSTSLTSSYIGGGAVGSPAPGNGTGQGLSPFNLLDPSNIESISVLKDADATAIYGSRGANGVILITTKKGKQGISKFDINVNTGVGKVTRKLQLLNTPEYLKMRREADSNDGYPLDPGYDIDLLVWDTTRYTNWQKVLIGNTESFTNAQASYSSGGTNTQFIVGGAISKQGTVFIGDYDDRKASGYFSLSHTSANDRFHLDISATYVNDKSCLPTIDFTSDITLAADAPSLYLSNGSLNWAIRNGAATWGNPAATTFQNANSSSNNLVSNITFNYQIYKGLQFKSSLGYTVNEMSQSNTYPGAALPPPLNNNPSYRSNRFSTSNIKSWIIEPQLVYSKTFFWGRVEALLGTTFQENSTYSIGQQATGFSNDALISDPQAATTLKLFGVSQNLYHYDAAFARLSYDWLDKYLINFTARRDGSSRFGANRQFGDFGAIGAAWIFSNEKLVKSNLKFLSFGKLRGSVGATGNDQITDYQYLSSYSPSSQSYQNINGLSPTRIANPYFGWEQVKKYEGGIELGFLKNRVLISGSWYLDRTGNQLVGYSLPSLAGFTSIQANLPAIVDNSGFELTLNTTNIRSQHFTWTTTFNLTLPKNKLVSFPDLKTSPYVNTYQVGQSIYSRKLFHYVDVNDTTGIYEFGSSKGGITNSPSYPGDLMISKPITQQLFGGVQNSFRYTAFQLDLFFEFVKQRGYNVLSSFSSPGMVNQNLPTYYLSRWQKPGDVTSVGYFSTISGADPNAALGISDYGVSDASFIRLKNIALYYTLPQITPKALHLQNARIYFLAQNLITITKYLGLDPETQGLTLPPLRMLTFGIQISL